MVRYILNIGHTSLNQFSNYQNFSYLNRGSFQARMPFVSLIRNHNRKKNERMTKYHEGVIYIAKGFKSVSMRGITISACDEMTMNDSPWMRTGLL